MSNFNTLFQLAEENEDLARDLENLELKIQKKSIEKTIAIAKRYGFELAEEDFNLLEE